MNTRGEALCFTSERISIAAGEVTKIFRDRRCPAPLSTVLVDPHFLSLLFVWFCTECVVCKCIWRRKPSQHDLWFNGACLKPVPLLRAGSRTHQFSSRTLEASCRLLFLPELPAPCVNTPYIYINIHWGKNECSIISQRLMNLSCSRRNFFFLFFFCVIWAGGGLSTSPSLHKTNQTWCCAAGVSMS